MIKMNIDKNNVLKLKLGKICGFTFIVSSPEERHFCLIPKPTDCVITFIDSEPAPIVTLFNANDTIEYYLKRYFGVDDVLNDLDPKNLQVFTKQSDFEIAISVKA